MQNVCKVSLQKTLQKFLSLTPQAKHLNILPGLI